MHVLTTRSSPRSTWFGRSVGFCLFVGVLVLLPRPSASQAPPLNPASGGNLFAAAVRLEKKLTLAHRDTPLGDLLQQLGKELGVRLRTTADTQNEKVTLFLKERPAGEVLTLLAEQFEFRWYRKEDGYELAQPAESKRREAELREERQRAQFAPIQVRVDLVARFASLSEAQRQAHTQGLNARLAAGDLTPGERQRLSEEQAALTDVEQRGAQIAVSVFRSLRPAHFARLRERGTLLITTMDRDLSPILARQIHAAVFSRNGGQAELVPPGQAVWAQVMFTLQGVDDPGNHAGPRGQRGLRFSCAPRAAG